MGHVLVAIAAASASILAILLVVAFGFTLMWLTTGGTADD